MTVRIEWCDGSITDVKEATELDALNIAEKFLGGQPWRRKDEPVWGFRLILTRDEGASFVEGARN